MRKLLWCCTLAVVAAGCLGVAAYRVWLHPQSMMIRCAQALTQTVGVWHTLSALSIVSTAPTAGQERAVQEMIPAEPQPVPPTATTTIARKEELPAPPPIVIPEEEAEQARGSADLKPAEGLVQAQEEKTPPALMPLVDDEPADHGEKAGKEGKDAKSDPFQSWLKYFDNAPASGQAEDSESVEPQSPPSCQEDSHYHEHYSGCPASVCPYTGKSEPSAAPLLPPAVPEKRSEAAPTKQPSKVLHHSAEKHSVPVTHPDVDTMEYRPSDGPITEYGPGGPF